MAYDACEISTSVKNATVEDVMQANKVVRKAKSNTVRLRFRDLGDVKGAELISFSDASLGNLKDGASQGGHIIILVGKNGNYSPISWQSKKIRHVIKSTLAAEILVLQEGAESCYILRSIIDEIYQLLPEESVQVKCLTLNFTSILDRYKETVGKLSYQEGCFFQITLLIALSGERPLL